MCPPISIPDSEVLEKLDANDRGEILPDLEPHPQKLALLQKNHIDSENTDIASEVSSDQEENLKIISLAEENSSSSISRLSTPLSVGTHDQMPISQQTSPEELGSRPLRRSNIFIKYNVDHNETVDESPLLSSARKRTSFNAAATTNSAPKKRETLTSMYKKTENNANLPIESSSHHSSRLKIDKKAATSTINAVNTASSKKLIVTTPAAMTQNRSGRSYRSSSIAAKPQESQIDFSQFDFATLTRYRRAFRIRGKPNVNKVQLVEAINEHNQKHKIEGHEVISNFVNFVKGRKLASDPRAVGSIPRSGKESSNSTTVSDSIRQT